MAALVWSRFARFHATWLLCVAVSFASGDVLRAQDRWYDAYDAALTAVKGSNWRAAEQSLRTAIERGPKTRGPQVLRYGTRREPFFPEYYLALALLNQDRPGEAAALFAQIQRDNLVSRDAPEFPLVAANLQKAQEADRLARATPPVTQSPVQDPLPPPVDTVAKDNPPASPPLAPTNLREIPARDAA